MAGGEKAPLRPSGGADGTKSATAAAAVAAAAAAAQPGVHPERRESCCSTTFLSWLWPVAIAGFKAPLQPAQIPALPESLGCPVARRTAIGYWENELGSGRKPTLLRMLWQFHEREMAVACMYSTLYGLTNVVLRPLLLKLTLEAIMTGETPPGVMVSTGENGTQTSVLFYGNAEPSAGLLASMGLVLAIAVSSLVEGLFQAVSRHYMSDRVGTAAIGKIAVLLHWKSGRLEGSATPQSNATTLVGGDLVRLYENGKLLSLFPMCVSGCLGGCGMLVYTLGWPALIGIGTMLLITVLLQVLAKQIAAVEHQELKAQDARLAIVRQVVTDVKPIKLCSWEQSFLTMIGKARDAEITQMMRYRILFCASVQVGRAEPFLAACPTFATLALAGEDFSASNVFAALSVFLALRLTLIMLPITLSLAAATKVTLERVEAYLALPEFSVSTGAPP